MDGPSDPEILPTDETELPEQPEEEEASPAVEATVVIPPTVTVERLPSVELPDPETLLSSSSEGLKLLSSIDASIWRYISYADQLTVFMQKPREMEAGLTPAGNYSLTVEPVWYMDCDCYKIRGDLKYELPDFSAEFTLTSYVTPTLRTIHENKVLIYKSRQQVIERKANIVIVGDAVGHINTSLSFDMTYSTVLTNQHAYQAGLYVPEVHKSVLNTPPGFLGEGANLMLDRILTRYMANKTILPDLLNKLCYVILTPTTDGTDDIVKPPQVGPPVPAFMTLLAPPKATTKKYLSLATISYSTLPSRQITVNEAGSTNIKQSFELTGFERLVQPAHKDVLPIVSFCYHLQDGRLAIQLQAGCPVQLQITVAPLIVPEDEFLKVHEVERKELDWENDAQLESVFQERTDELKNDFLSFIRHKPELRSLLADFLQALLLRKPDNVIAFAAQYFSAFGSTRLLSSEIPSS